MRLSPYLTEARLITRLNRFAALVSLRGAETMVHVANSGRLQELLQAGNRVFLAPVAGDKRKTAYDLALVDLGGTLASADARLPSALVHEALGEGRLPPFVGYTSFRREAAYGESRLDLLLEGPAGLCFMEVKSITLVEEGVALFPDAATTRGRKHLRSLARAAQEGHRAAVVFVIQREDATRFEPNDPADPEFGLALREAARQGVEVYAYRCRLSREEIRLDSRIPVHLWS